MDNLADVVRAEPVFGDHVAELALVRARPFFEGALEVGEVFFGDVDGFGFVPDEDVDDSVDRAERD